MYGPRDTFAADKTRARNAGFCGVRMPAFIALAPCPGVCDMCTHLRCGPGLLLPHTFPVVPGHHVRVVVLEVDLEHANAAGALVAGKVLWSKGEARKGQQQVC